MTHVNVYKFLLEYAKREAAREINVGTLSMHEESAFAARLEELWWKLSDEEQRDVNYTVLLGDKKVEGKIQ